MIVDITIDRLVQNVFFRAAVTVMGINKEKVQNKCRDAKLFLTDLPECLGKRSNMIFIPEMPCLPLRRLLTTNKNKEIILL